MFEKIDRRYPISVQKGTGAVPDDGRYHVVDNDEIILSTNVLAYALIIYEEAREAHRVAAGHPDPAQLRARARGERDVRALRAEGLTDATRRKGRGGPGGRGGV